jgi:hypothetical protein
MCDASDSAVGAILGQRVDKLPHFIYYTSRTLNDAPLNYSTMEKELLIVPNLVLTIERTVVRIVFTQVRVRIHRES